MARYFKNFVKFADKLYMKSLIILASFIFTSFAISSAKVCIVGNKLVLDSNLIFYGSEAHKVASSCAQEIYKMFNAPNVEINIKGKKLKVEFKVSYQVESEKAAFSSSNINKKVSNNYIRVEKEASNIDWKRSNHLLGKNSGFYSTNDDLGTSTTCAHEFAHGLGLKHYHDRKSKSGYGGKSSLIGKGRPGIMASRGFIVDKKYQYNSKAQPGKAGGSINPVNRVVRKEDILDLKLENLKFDRMGCANLGAISKTVYKKNGSKASSEFSYFSDAVDYLYKLNTGDLSKVRYCR